RSLKLPRLFFCQAEERIRHRNVTGVQTCALPISPATENLKNEKDSKWMYFVSTLPYSRNTYVSSHFAFYSLLAFTGMVVSLVINAIVAGSIVSGVNSALLGTGFIALYSLIFPFTFKMGAEKSNVIFMIVSIIVVILFFIYYFV